MKGRKVFSAKDMAAIKKLVKEKEEASSNRQKSIRGKIREMGFYYSDFSSSKNGYTVKDVENLISSGEIEIEDEESNNFQTSRKAAHDKQLTVLTELNDILGQFKENFFDPMLDSEMKIPDASGNYIMCLKEGSILPYTTNSPDFEEFDHLQVIYTGIAGTSLRKRDFRAHFKGNNAGRSTLRKSLGVLFGYEQIPRDKDPTTGKTMFSQTDEEKLTEWMCANLVMYFYQNANYRRLENKLIELFNPPLNLDGNNSDTNREFRKHLSRLRNKKEK